MRVLVSGASGFVGQALATALADRADLQSLLLTDRAPCSAVPPGARFMVGDIADPEFWAECLAGDVDVVFHLASMPGALAEREFERGSQVNLFGPLAAAQQLAARASGRSAPPRFVFASSIAVYGALGTEPVHAQTRTAPELSYGAHKRMMEMFLSDLHRRGQLSAVSLRLPGVVARPPEESGHGSAFMSEIIRHGAAGKPYACPVPAHASCWWLSLPACVAALLHAMEQGAGPAVVQIPVLHETVGKVAAAAAQYGGVPLSVQWGDDVQRLRLFGSMPPLNAEPALALGYRADGNGDELVRAALL